MLVYVCILLLVISFPVLSNMLQGKQQICFCDGFLLSKEKKNTKVGMTIIAIVMIAVAGMRNLSVGYDTRTYFLVFSHLKNMSFLQLEDFYMEIGWNFLNKIVSFLGGNFTIFLIIVSTITILGIFSFIYKTSDDVYLSILLFLGLGYFASSMNVMRQFVALSFVLSAIYSYVLEEKKLKGFVLVLIGVLFHKTCLLMLPVFLFFSIFRRTKGISKILISFLMIFFSLMLIVFLDNVVYYIDLWGIKSEESFFATGKTHSVLSLNLIIKVFFSFIYIVERKRNTFDGCRLNLMTFLNFLNVISCVFSVATVFYPLFSRFNIYFSLSLIVFIPNLLRDFPIKEKKLIYVLIWLGFVFLFLIELPAKSVVPWVPFFL